MNLISPNRSPQPSLDDLLFVLFKWKWTILCTAGLTVFLTVFWLSFLHEDLYQTSAKLIVKAGQEQSPPSTVLGQLPNTVAYRSADVKSEIDILQSTALLELLVEKYELDRERPRPKPKGFVQTVRAKVKGMVRSVRESVDEMMIMAGLRERLTAREKTLAGLGQGLSVKVPEGSNTILAELYLPFRTGSGAVLNALLKEYLEFRQGVYRDRGDEFFATEMKTRGAALAAAEAKLNEFERAATIVDQPQQKQLLLEKVVELDRLVSEAQIEYEKALSRSASLDSELRQPRPNYGALGDFDELDFQKTLALDIAALEKERQHLLLTEKEDGDRIGNVEAQLRSIGTILTANLRSVLAERKGRFDSLSAESSRLRREVNDLHSREVAWQDLRREAERLEEEYSFYRKKFEESSAARAALEQRMGNNVTVIQPAIDPIQPAGIQKTVYLSLSLVVGILLSLSFVALAEFFDHRIYNASQLELETGLPVLAEITLRRGGLGAFLPRPGTTGAGPVLED